MSRGPPSSSDNQDAASQLAKQGYEYGKTRMMLASDADKELWSIVEDVPRLTAAWPYLTLILNVILPGIGTMIIACVGYQGPWSKTQLTVGILQSLTSVFLIGWIWSIWWGVKIVRKSLEDQQQVQNYLDKTNARQGQ